MHLLPAPALHLLEGRAGVFVPTSIVIIDVAVRLGRPRKLRQVVDEGLQCLLARFGAESRRLCLELRVHERGHFERHDEDAVGAALGIGNGLVDEVAEGLFGGSAFAPRQHHALRASDEGLAGSADGVEQLDEPLSGNLGKRVHQALAYDGAAAHELAVTGVRDFEHVLLAPEHGDRRRCVLEHGSETLQLLLVGFAQRLLHRRTLPRMDVAFDHEGGGVPEEPHDLEVTCGRSGDHAVVERERSEHSSLGREDRRRPARPESMMTGECLELCPQRIGLDVSNDHGASGERRGAARADRRTDGDAVNGGVVLGGQARSGPEQEVLARAVEKEDRAEDARRRLALDGAHDHLEDLRERSAVQRALQRFLLPGKDGFVARGTLRRQRVTVGVRLIRYVHHEPILSFLAAEDEASAPPSRGATSRPRNPSSPPGLQASLLASTSFDGAAMHREAAHPPARTSTSALLPPKLLWSRVMLEPSDAPSSGHYPLADAMPLIVWIHGDDGVPTYLNSKWAEYTGVGVEESLRAGVHTFVHPDDLPAMDAASKHARRTDGAGAFDASYRLRRHDGEYRWHVARVVPLPVRGTRRSWLGTAMDVHEQRRREQQRTFLIDATRVLGTSLDVTTTLNDVARLAVPHLSDWCAIDLLDAEGSLVRHAVAHVDPTKVALAWDLWKRVPPQRDDPSGAYAVMRDRKPYVQREDPEPLLVAAIQDPELLALFRQLRLRSWVLAPLIARDRVLGTLTLVSSESGRVYDDDDVTFAVDFAQRISIAVDNARLYEEATQARAAAEALASDVIEQTHAAQAALVEMRTERDDLAAELERVTRLAPP